MSAVLEVGVGHVAHTAGPYIGLDQQLSEPDESRLRRALAVAGGIKESWAYRAILCGDTAVLLQYAVEDTGHRLRCNHNGEPILKATCIDLFGGRVVGSAIDTEVEP